MNTNQQQNNSEEVDLGQLFNAIGNLFQRLFNFIASIFKGIFAALIFLLKAIITYFKIIAIVLVVAFIIGFAMDKTVTPTYESNMLVMPHFGSKYQLIDNIEFYNALISNSDINKLSEIFEISQEQAQSLIKFNIEAGPESDTDKLRQYDEFLVSIDTSRAKEISYTEYLENRDIFSPEIYEITAVSHKIDVFKALEKGINKAFDNEYSKLQLSKRNTMAAIEKASIEASLNSIDSIQSAYIKSLEAKSSTGSISFGEGLNVEANNESSKELGLIKKEIELRAQLRKLEQELVEENEIFDVISGFKENGIRSSNFFRTYKLLLPTLAFILLSLVFFAVKIVKFTKSY